MLDLLAEERAARPLRGALMEPLEAALTVLREEGEPLHWTRIQDLALRRGYLDPFEQPGRAQGSCSRRSPRASGRASS